MRVTELMSSNVATCAPADNLAAVAAQMWDRDVGAIVVVDEENRPLGMVTDRDLCMAAYTRGCALSAANVGSLMGRPVITCKLGDTAASAAEGMALHQVRRLPVIDDDGHLAGIVTLGDIARGHQCTELAGAALAVIATPRQLAGPAQASPGTRARKRERAA